MLSHMIGERQPACCCSDRWFLMDENAPTPFSYDKWFQQKLNEFQPGLANDLSLIPGLEKPAQESVLDYLLELACRAQRIDNINLGRQAIWSIPRTWLLAHIEEAAEPLIQLNDEWEYRRLIELFWYMDIQLVKRLAQRGQNHQNPGISEAAQECLEMISHHKLDDVRGAPAFDYWEDG